MLRARVRRKAPAKAECPKSDTFGVVRPVIFHPQARDDIRGFPTEARARLGRGLYRLQMGESLGMPNARPMPTVASVLGSCA